MLIRFYYVWHAEFYKSNIWCMLEIILEKVGIIYFIKESPSDRTLMSI